VFTGIDHGGLRREWFTIVLDRLFNTRGGLFQRFNKDDAQGLVRIKLNLPPSEQNRQKKTV